MKIKNYKSFIISSAAMILEAVIFYVISLCTAQIDPMTIPFITMVFLLPISTFGFSVYIGATKPLMLIPFAAVSFVAQTVAPAIILSQGMPSFQSALGMFFMYAFLPAAAGGLIGLIIKILVKKFKK